MKCGSNISDETSTSTDQCSMKLKVLCLVTNTANLINERTTPTISISYAVVSPIALFTTYIFLGILVLGATQSKRASSFLQIYAIVSCVSIHTTLSIIVFRDLKHSENQMEVAHILNGVLPMLTIVLLIADLIVILFSTRETFPAPAMPIDSRTQSL